MFGGHRICYYTNWAQYRGGDGRYVAADVDGSLCDVVVYCFATMNGNEMATLEWNDETMLAAKFLWPILMRLVII